MTHAPSPFSACADRVRVALRVIPKASRNRIDGLESGTDGKAYLKVRVTAAPERGKANSAVVKMLAKYWGQPKGQIKVIAGATARNKVVEVSGPGERLLRDLEEWLKQHKGEN